MYKLVVSDLDETLLNSDKRISKKNREAIKKAESLGVKFVPASGRGYETIQETVKELGLYNKPGEYIISFNGGAITENDGNKLLYYKGLDFPKVKELFKKGIDSGLSIHLYTKDEVYIYGITPDEAEYLKGRMEYKELPGEDIDFLESDGIVKILYVNPDYQALKEFRKQMDREGLTDGLEVSYSAGRYLEFNPEGVNKGSGVLQLAKRLGLKPEEVVAVGDNVNDLPMIEAAGLGVGVQNSNEDIKDLCDVITDATNDEDAIAEVIERYVIPSLSEGD